MSSPHTDMLEFLSTLTKDELPNIDIRLSEFITRKKNKASVIP